MMRSANLTRAENPMADLADRAYLDEAMLLEAKIQAARRTTAAVLRGTCLYCGEPCPKNAVLHDYCREDYEREQAIRRRQRGAVNR